VSLKISFCLREKKVLKILRDLREFLWMMTLILARLLSFTQLLLLILHAMLCLFRLLEGIRIDFSGVPVFSRKFKKNMLEGNALPLIIMEVGNWMSPILVSFCLGKFSTSMIFERE